MRCENCNKRIGLFKKIGHKYFDAIIDFRMNIISYPKKVYFCNELCIKQYQKKKNIIILN